MNIGNITFCFHFILSILEQFKENSNPSQDYPVLFQPLTGLRRLVIGLINISCNLSATYQRLVIEELVDSSLVFIHRNNNYVLSRMP